MLLILLPFCLLPVFLHEILEGFFDQFIEAMALPNGEHPDLRHEVLIDTSPELLLGYVEWFWRHGGTLLKGPHGVK